MRRNFFLVCALLTVCASVGIVLWKAFVPTELVIATVVVGEVHIRAADNSQLVAADRTLFGATTDPGGTTYISQRGGTTQAELFVWNKTTGNIGRFLAWREGAGTTAVLHAARGVDVGATAEPNGSFWRNTGGDIFFAHGGRIFAPDRVQIQNNVSGTSLHIFSNSARTSLLATVAAGSTWTDSVNRRSYWLRLSGAVRTDEAFNVDLFGTLSGFLYQVNGTYTAGSDSVNSCGVGHQTNVTCETSNISRSCGVNTLDGSCTNIGARSCVFDILCGYATPWLCSHYSCITTTTGGSSPIWSVSTARGN